VCVFRWKTAEFMCLYRVSAALDEWYSEAWIERNDTSMRKVILIFAGLTLASCYSPEFLQQQNICYNTWIKKLPHRFVQESFQLKKSRQVPTGQFECISTVEGHIARSVCKEITATEYFYVPSVRTVDRDKSIRDNEIAVCTRQSCISTYGNVNCEL
jgi:hypothetical protein